MKSVTKHILQMAVLLLCSVFASCNLEMPTYNVQVSGTVIDTKGNPVVGASIKIVDRRKDPNSILGIVGSAYIDRIVGTTTTDENGHYALSVTTEGLLFDVSAIRKEQNWDTNFAQSGSIRCDCASEKSAYTLDMVAKTEKEYYTGSVWKDAVEATPLEVGLSDSIQIRLKDGGTILTAGIWFDSPYTTQENGVSVTRHSFKSDYNMYYRVDGGDFSIAPGLTEYKLVFTMDTIAGSISSCSIPYCERCYLKVTSIKTNKDEDSYYIPLRISS